MIDEATQARAIIRELRIKSDKIDIKLENLPYLEGYKYVKDLVESHPDDEFLQECWRDGDKRVFGFMGRGHGDKDWSIDVRMPEIKGTEKFVCPEGQSATMGWQKEHAENATWDKRGDDRCCSYCGSIHPEDLMNLVKQYGLGIIGGTTKSYKWYVGINAQVRRPNIPNAGFGGIKFYKWHMTDELRDFINEEIKKIETK